MSTGIVPDAMVSRCLVDAFAMDDSFLGGGAHPLSLLDWSKFQPKQRDGRCCTAPHCTRCTVTFLPVVVDTKIPSTLARSSIVFGEYDSFRQSGVTRNIITRPPPPPPPRPPPNRHLLLPGKAAGQLTMRTLYCRPSIARVGTISTPPPRQPALTWACSHPNVMKRDTRRA